MVNSESRPTVSVIISTYNWSSALACALRSVQLQSFADYEVLVVGDGCTDDSEAVVASFGDERFKWHNLEYNYGNQYAPNNHGLSVARGKWVAYLGHDDIWHPTHLEACLRAAEQQGVDLVASVGAVFGPPGSGMCCLSGVFLDKQYVATDHLPPSTLIHRRDLIERIGPWKHPDLVATTVDCEFLARAAEANTRIGLTHELTVFKFAALWRRDSYKLRDVTEQRHVLDGIERGEDVRHAALIAAQLSTLAGNFNRMPMPSTNAALGKLTQFNRGVKGLGGPRTDLPPIDGVQRFGVSDLTMPFEWHLTETHERFGEYRWSGPLSQSTIDILVKFDRDIKVRLHVIAVLQPEVLDRLKLNVNGAYVPFERMLRPEGTQLLSFVARPAESRDQEPGLRVIVDVQKTERPISLGINQDVRALGIALNWIEVEPV